MIKKISLKQLSLGMFVHDLNCGDISHPLIQTRFKVDNSLIIDNLHKRGIPSVYIDTSLGIDVPDAPTLEEIHSELDVSLIKLAHKKIGKNLAFKEAQPEEELAAQQLHQEANSTVREIMNLSRLGIRSSLEKVNPIVQGIVESIFRNATPLLQLRSIRTKDQYLFFHSVATCSLISAFAHTLQIGHDITRQMALGMLLHDIGKTRIPEHILNKPGKLTEAEFEHMRLHVAHGLDILSYMDEQLPSISLQVITQHHERFDGTGYPIGLKGNQISQYGQMAAIVDVYDAITSARCYHNAMEPFEAIRKLKEWSEHHFNAELVEHFICCIGIYPVGTLVRLDNDTLAVVCKHNPADLLKPEVLSIYDAHKQIRITPKKIDLATETEYQILGYEQAEKWHLTLSEFTSLMTETI